MQVCQLITLDEANQGKPANRNLQAASSEMRRRQTSLQKVPSNELTSCYNIHLYLPLPGAWKPIKNVEGIA